MPFKSKSQMRRFAELVKTGDMTQAKYDEWMRATPNVDALPDKVAPASQAKIKKAKVIR